MKHLLPATSFFKANLHTHTTITDGKLSPEEVKEAYKALGYQILCLTDHNVAVDHSDMNEPDFLMLTGLEVNINEPGLTASLGKTYHLNLIAKRPDNLWSPSKAYHWFNSPPYEEKMCFEEMPLRYDPEFVNTLIAKSNEKGFLVSYNHPVWSCQSYPDYAPLKGLWAMELCNAACVIQGYSENNAHVYRDLLNLGNRLYPLGTDDMHRPIAIGGSWIQVGASQLTYEDVIQSLEKGDFYMSCGPEIHSLTLDGNILKITCSDAKGVALESNARFTRQVHANGETLLQEAEFDLTKFKEVMEGQENAFIRLTVYAPDGTYAATRAYFLDEL